MSIRQKSHFLNRQSTLSHSIPFKMWYLYLPLFGSLTYDIPYLSLSSASPAIFIWCLVFYLFVSGVYLIFVKAATLILKHATLLQTSNQPKEALTNVDLNYQKANVHESIQQYLMACAPELSVEQFASFIMGTDIGLFLLLPFVTSISYCPLVLWSGLHFLFVSSVLYSLCDSWLMTCIFVLWLIWLSMLSVQQPLHVSLKWFLFFFGLWHMPFFLSLCVIAFK